jgi:hypothetical protein
MILSKIHSYVSLKVVRAVIIEDFKPSATEAGRWEFKFKDHPWQLPEYPLGKSFTLPENWVTKHQPQIGWYLIEYSNGYTSTCPPDAFEKENALITDSRVMLHFTNMIREHLIQSDASKQLWLDSIVKLGVTIGLSEITSVGLAASILQTIFGVSVEKDEYFKTQIKEAEKTIPNETQVLSVLNKLQANKQHVYTSVKVEGDVLVATTDMGNEVEIGSYSDIKLLEQWLEAKK